MARTANSVYAPLYAWQKVSYGPVPASNPARIHTRSGDCFSLIWASISAARLAAVIDAPPYGNRTERPGLLVEEGAATCAAPADLVSRKNRRGFEVRTAFQRKGVQLELLCANRLNEQRLCFCGH